MSLPFTKKAIRSSLLRRRQGLRCDEVVQKSLKAQERLIAQPVFAQAKTLALYSPIRNEVETDHLLSVALATGKKVCFPCVSGENLNFFQVRTPRDLTPGCFGICEPSQKVDEIDPALLDLLLLPGIAFDLRGARLGYGRGYFDRLLADRCFSALCVGFCYDFQVQKRLPAEDHDQGVALLVTDQKIYSPSLL